jgi:hypothetical protein
VEAFTIVPHRQDAAAPSQESFTSRGRVAPARPLTKEPLIKIRPGRASVSSELREVWAHRELLYFLIWRDLKVRYKQTALGPAWVVLQQLLMALVFTIFMGWLARVPSDGVPYPLFAYAGLVPWTFFSSAVSTAGNGLIANSQLVTKVFFPSMLIHLALTGVRLTDFLVSFVVLLVLMLCYGVGVRPSILLLPVLVLQATLLAVGVAFAEVEEFLDTPVKHYSTGMHLRLAFAVAAHFEPEILILDEVLAVGDAAFQQKCYRKMQDVIREGRTIFFVSHDPSSVQRLCGRALLIESGRLRDEGPAETVVKRYLDGVAAAARN